MRGGKYRAERGEATVNNCRSLLRPFAGRARPAGVAIARTRVNCSLKNRLGALSRNRPGHESLAMGVKASRRRKQFITPLDGLLIMHGHGRDELISRIIEIDCGPAKKHLPREERCYETVVGAAIDIPGSGARGH